MELREAGPNDWPSIYPIFAAVVAEGRTYAYPPGLTSDQAQALWLGQERAVVAEIDGEIVGTAIMGPNRPGRGAHIATASFMVAPESQGQGVGRALGVHMVHWARVRGYRGIQFNAVVETNEPAVRLWRSLGFEVIGTVPGAFLHAEQGYVGLHIMFKSLNHEDQVEPDPGLALVAGRATRTGLKSPHRSVRPERPLTEGRNDMEMSTGGSTTGTRTPRLPPRWFIKFFWKAHRAVLRLTGGRLGLWPARAQKWGTLRLTTVGRRSGQERSVILGYYEDGPNLVTMAMNGWGEAEPAWWLNLQAHPEARVQLSDGTRRVVARAAIGPERARLWDRWRALDKGLDEFARRRPRETAVVIFEPSPQPAAESAAES